MQAEGEQTAGAAAATNLRARGKSARAAATDAPVSAAEPDTLEAVYRTALQTLDQMQDIIEKGAEKNVSLREADNRAHAAVRSGKLS